jgi:site-specific DNA-methyltransferase (adenine-specific)
MTKITDKLTITNEDNMLLMGRYPDKYFDLAIVDPPYGINITNECMGGRKTVKPDKNKNWDNKTPNQEYFNELFRISKNQIIWGGNYFNLPMSRYFAIWDKGETMYGRDFAECEFAWVRNGGTRIYKLNPNQLERIHPTQKPVALYKWILDKYAKDGDKILDTHLGSGSIAIACHDYGFELTACELDTEYYEKAIERIKNHVAQQKLF